jgi:branched-chain amino acid transport system permease protein
LNTGYSPLTSWVPEGDVPRTHVLGLFSVNTEKSFYWLIVVVLALCLLMMKSLRRSRIGRTLIGVRDNERAAEALAVGPRGVLVTAFAMSGFLAGVAGALFVLQQRALDSSNFDPFASLQVFSMAVVGGLGSIGGAVLGALYLKGIDYFLTSPQWAFLSSGVGLIIILLIFPSGLGGALGDLRDGALRWYARRKHIRVPSLLADTRVDAPVVSDVDIAQAFTEAAEHATDLVEIHE